MNLLSSEENGKEGEGRESWRGVKEDIKKVLEKLSGF